MLIVAVAASGIGVGTAQAAELEGVPTVAATEERSGGTIANYGMTGWKWVDSSREKGAFQVMTNPSSCRGHAGLLVSAEDSPPVRESAFWCELHLNGDVKLVPDALLLPDYEITGNGTLWVTNAEQEIDFTYTTTLHSCGAGFFCGHFKAEGRDAYTELPFTLEGPIVTTDLLCCPDNEPVITGSLTYYGSR